MEVNEENEKNHLIKDVMLCKNLHGRMSFEKNFSSFDTIEN